LWINNFFGVLGWNYVGLPMALVTTLIGLLVLATIATHDVLNDLSARIQPRFLFIGAGLLTILSIFAVFYMTYTPVGGTIVGGLQGRYFLPGAAFVLAGLGALLPMKVTLSEKAAPTLYFSVLTVCLVASVYVYHSVLY